MPEINLRVNKDALEGLQACTCMVLQVFGVLAVEGATSDRWLPQCQAVTSPGNVLSMPFALISRCRCSCSLHALCRICAFHRQRDCHKKGTIPAFCLNPHV